MGVNGHGDLSGHRGPGERANANRDPPTAVTNWCRGLACSVATTPISRKRSGPARSTDGLLEWEMARARELLDTTELHVAEIGREVGYADPVLLLPPVQPRPLHEPERLPAPSQELSERMPRTGSGRRIPTMSRSTANPTMVEHRSHSSDREPEDRDDRACPSTVRR